MCRLLSCPASSPGVQGSVAMSASVFICVDLWFDALDWRICHDASCRSFRSRWRLGPGAAVGGAGPFRGPMPACASPRNPHVEPTPTPMHRAPDKPTASSPLPTGGADPPCVPPPPGPAVQPAGQPPSTQTAVPIPIPPLPGPLQLTLAVESPGALNIRVALTDESAGGPTKPLEPAPPPGGPPSPGFYRYALWRDEGLWELWFDGRQATLKHERGLLYVTHALGHPGVLVKKLELATLYASFARRKAGITEAWDQRQGVLVPLGKEPLAQRPVEREDDQEARERLEKLARELWATVADPKTLESERAEARRQLREIADFLRRDSRQLHDEYRKAGDSVRFALKHLFRTLLKPGGAAMSPPEVRRAFAEHLERYLVIPSSRYSAPKARREIGRASCRERV